MKNINRFIGTLALAIALVASAASVSAQQYGSGQYGTGPYSTGSYGQQPTQPEQRILVDKQVATPGSATGSAGETAGVYRDNLPLSYERYQPGQEVVFRIIVRNISNVTVQNVVVRDTIPSYAEPMVGPGIYDAATRTVTYTISQLQPNEENVQYVKMKIFAQSRLPANETIIRQVNTVEARLGTEQDIDTAQYFIEKQVVGVSKVPDTGPELGLAFLALQGIGLTVGLKLRQHRVNSRLQF
ncbi:MAG: DUF11 domain-containing protein [Patescibacteria group bacterium]|nr:DUF11 domain-containing protein [Patescibacteria group bacterium]